MTDSLINSCSICSLLNTASGYQLSVCDRYLILKNRWGIGSLTYAENQYLRRIIHLKYEKCSIWSHLLHKFHFRRIKLLFTRDNTILSKLSWRKITIHLNLVCSFWSCKKHPVDSRSHLGLCFGYGGLIILILRANRKSLSSGQCPRQKHSSRSPLSPAGRYDNRAWSTSGTWSSLDVGFIQIILVQVLFWTSQLLIELCSFI